MGQCVAGILIEHSKTTADFAILPLPSPCSRSVRLQGKRELIGPFLPLPFYYFQRSTTLFSCDTHPFSNPLFESLRMQHPWNLDTFYFRRCGNKGEKASEKKVAGGRAFLEKSYSLGTGNWNLSLCVCTKSLLWPWLAYTCLERSSSCRKWERHSRPRKKKDCLSSKQPQHFSFSGFFCFVLFLPCFSL